MKTVVTVRNENTILKIPEIARILGMGQSACANWLRDGKIPKAFKLGNRWAVWREDLETFIAELKEN